jgi:acyl-CoA thioesterase
MATPEEIAQAVGQAMLARDAATHALGMQLVAVAPGAATLSMTVRADMLNGHGTCHGGLITSLADSAFAFACNAYNELTVASGFDVNLLAAAYPQDVLTAKAIEVSRAGRMGVYDVSVTNQAGKPVAAFRGRSYSAKGKAVVVGLPVGKLAKDV